MVQWLNGSVDFHSGKTIDSASIVYWFDGIAKQPHVSKHTPGSVILLMLCLNFVFVEHLM